MAGSWFINPQLSSYNTNILPTLDLVSGTVEGSLRCLFNQGIAHLNAWPGVYNAGNLNYGCWNMPYVDSFGSMNLGNLIGYAIARNNWSNAQNGGAIFDLNTGAFNFKVPNFTGATNSPFMSFPNTTGKVNGNDGTGNDEVKEEDKIEAKIYEKKLERLKQLVDLLINNGGLNETDKAKLEVALEEAEGTSKEQFEALKKVYKEIAYDKNGKLKNSFITAIKNDEGYLQLNNSDYSVKELLALIGNKDSVDVTELEKAINSLGKDNAGDAENTILAGLGFDNDNILDVISSWNSKKKTNIMELITSKENYNEVKDDNKETTRTQVIEPLTTTLTEKANELINTELLDEASVATIKTAIKKLNEAIIKDKSDYNEKASENLGDAFNNLYRLTRLAAATVLEYNVKEAFGGIDADLFKEPLFINDTVKDLKSEGFKNVTGKEIKINKDAEVNIPAENENLGEGKDDKKADIKAELNELVADGVVAKQTGIEYTVTEEVTNENGEKTTKDKIVSDEIYYQKSTGKYFAVITTGEGEEATKKLVELKYAELKDGKLVGKNGAEIEVIDANITEIKTDKTGSESEAEKKLKEIEINELVKSTKGSHSNLLKKLEDESINSENILQYIKTYGGKLFASVYGSWTRLDTKCGMKLLEVLKEAPGIDNENIKEIETYLKLAKNNDSFAFGKDLDVFVNKLIKDLEI